MIGFSMKQQVVYIHGGDSFSSRESFIEYLKTRPIYDLPTERPKLSWKKSLAADLGAGFEVFQPTMPNSTNARYAEWKIWFERYFVYLHDGVILVGCSLGGMFLAKYLSENAFPVKIKALFLLAAPGGEFLAPPETGDCRDFTFAPELAQNLATRVPIVHVWHSKDDYVVPVSEADWYKTHVRESQITLFEDKNHFLDPALPELITAIKVV